MNDLDKARKKLELMKVKCAKEEMQFKILERQADIDRIKQSINAQDERIKELETELQGE